jgi:hypothetical protein
MSDGVFNKDGAMSLWLRIIIKHDWVWAQKARWSLEIRDEVCHRLWAAANRAYRSGL